MMERYLKEQILADLKDKMVLLAGPRQVGKTTLAKSLPKTPAATQNRPVVATSKPANKSCLYD